MTDLKTVDLTAEYKELLECEHKLYDKALVFIKPLLRDFVADLKQAFAACLKNKKYRDLINKKYKNSDPEVKIVSHLTEVTFHDTLFTGKLNSKCLTEDIESKQAIDKMLISYVNLTNVLKQIGVSFNIDDSSELSYIKYWSGEQWHDHEDRIIFIANDEELHFDFSDLQHLI